MTAGDNCSAPVMINTRGRSRTLMTTCGQRDDVNTDCGTGGSDVVFALRLSTSGTFSVRLTAPTGVTLSIGSDGPGRACASYSSSRTCLGSGTQRTVSGTAGPGDIYYYVATSQPATLVIDAELP